MIGLVDFLKASGINLDTGTKRGLKIHLACWNGRLHPLDEYYAGRFKEWQEWQGRQHFRCAQLVSLIDLGQCEWLFAGAYRILNCKKDPRGLFKYSTKLLPKQEELIGRITVHHKRTRNSRIWHKPEVELPIIEISREKRTIEDFLGYNSVIVNHSHLKIITSQKIASWHGALANIKGVYLITDTTTGRHYVGKASGQSGIWQRWCAYAENGHGGTKELRALLKQMGDAHMAHFQYSILEIADSHASDEDILARESYWMKALRTRQHGLN